MNSHDSILQKAIHARLQRDFKGVSRYLSQIRRNSFRVALSSNQRAHFEILETVNPQFGLDMSERQLHLQNSGEKMTVLERNESFLYLYEYSGVLIHQRNYMTALQFSLKAETQSRDPNAWASAHLNTLICYEALGVSIETELEDFNIFLQDFATEIRNEKVYTELSGLRLRRAFRLGQISCIDSDEYPDSWYWTWLQLLPQLSFSQERKIKIPHAQIAEMTYGKFIQNTLLFHLDFSELKSPPMNHWCDRLYLWTWMACKNPSQVPLTHVLTLLEEFDFERHIHQMTVEDRILVRHSLDLIGLFDPKTYSLSNSLFLKLAPLRYELFPYLQHERTIIEELKKRTQHNTSGAVWAKMAGWAGFAVLFRQEPVFLKKQDKIRVDCSLGKVEGPFKKWVVYSEDMARAFLLLFEHGADSTLNLNEFYTATFSAFFFDPLVHYRKLYNLLSRMKKLSKGSLTFKIRGQKLYYQIQPQKYIFLQPKTTPGFDQKRWFGIVSRLYHVKTALETIETNETATLELLRPQFSICPQSTRQQIQTALGWNKSMTLREIKKLLQQRVLVKSGRGKKSLYSLHSPTV